MESKQAQLILPNISLTVLKLVFGAPIFWMEFFVPFIESKINLIILSTFDVRLKNAYVLIEQGRSVLEPFKMVGLLIRQQPCLWC